MLHKLIKRNWRSLFWLGLATLGMGYANATCVELRENSEVTLSTASSSTGEICITLRDLHPNETYFMVDKSYPGMNSPALVGYDARWQLTNGSTVYNKNIYTDFDMAKINLQSHDRATLRLKKAQNSANYDYTFNIINNREIQGYSIISVVMSAKPKATSQPTPPVPPPGGGCDYVRGELICTNPFSTPVNPLSTNAVLLGDVVAVNGSQCNADNRPPSPAPYARDGSGRQMNLNSTLRQAKGFHHALSATFGANLAALEAATWLHLYQNHKMEGLYDVKSGSSPWLGDEDFGNFLYGAVMYQHGFSATATQRFSAGYQAIQNARGFTWTSAPRGFFNFITNTGDGIGDPEMVMRGYRYARDVHSQNPTNTQSLSCIDQRTLDQSATHGGGGGASGGSTGNVGSGTLMSMCELWYFSSGLSNGLFYMEKNCQFWMIP